MLSASNCDLYKYENGFLARFGGCILYELKGRANKPTGFEFFDTFKSYFDTKHYIERNFDLFFESI